MEPTLAGYFPKRTAKRPDWLAVPTVDEICSASGCISEGPKYTEWIQHWRHNALQLFNTREAAWNIVDRKKRYKFDLYAYAIFPVQFDEGQEGPLVLPALSWPLRPLDAEPLSDRFVRLGYDAVSNSGGVSFECSPLSCNYMAREIPVNRYCLLDDLQAALDLARSNSVSAGGGETGPYNVVEVWRDESWRAYRARAS